jgi:hypothetical protein
MHGLPPMVHRFRGVGCTQDDNCLIVWHVDFVRDIRSGALGHTPCPHELHSAVDTIKELQANGLLN